MEAVECSVAKKPKCEYHSVLFEFDEGDDDCELNRVFNELYECVDDDDLHEKILKVDGVAAEIVRVCKEYEEQVCGWMIRVDLDESRFKFNLLDYVSSLLWPCCAQALSSPPHTQVAAEDDRDDEEFGGCLSFDLSNAFFEPLLDVAKLEMGEWITKHLASVKSVDTAKLDDGEVARMKRIEQRLVRAMNRAFSKSPYALSLRDILRRRIRRVCQEYTGSSVSYDNIILPDVM
jgi:hypothetical protein